MVTLAACNLTDDDDANAFYDEKVIARIYELAEAINDSTSYLALDAVRNLIN